MRVAGATDNEQAQPELRVIEQGSIAKAVKCVYTYYIRSAYLSLFNALLAHKPLPSVRATRESGAVTLITGKFVVLHLHASMLALILSLGGAGKQPMINIKNAVEEFITAVKEAQDDPVKGSGELMKARAELP